MPDSLSPLRPSPRAVAIEPGRVRPAVNHFSRRGWSRRAGQQGFQFPPQLAPFFGSQVIQWRAHAAAGHTHQLAPRLAHRHGQGAVGLLHCAAPPLVGQRFDVLQVPVVKLHIVIAGGGLVDELDVVIVFRGVKTPVRGVGEHYLLAEPQLFRLVEYPLVRRADDGVLANHQVRLNGNLLVETGFLDADDVGDGAEPLQPRRADGDAKLRGVVKHHRQVGAVRDLPHEIDYLLLGFW